MSVSLLTDEMQCLVPSVLDDALESHSDNARECAQKFEAWCNAEQIRTLEIRRDSSWRAWRHAWILATQQRRQ